MNWHYFSVLYCPIKRVKKYSMSFWHWLEPFLFNDFSVMNSTLMPPHLTKLGAIKDEPKWKNVKGHEDSEANLEITKLQCSRLSHITWTYYQQFYNIDQYNLIKDTIYHSVLLFTFKYKTVNRTSRVFFMFLVLQWYDPSKFLVIIRAQGLWRHVIHQHLIGTEFNRSR